MSTATAPKSPAAYWETEPHHHPEGASTNIGFWVYLMSDCLMFAVLFATFGVLHGSYAAGPGPQDLFDLELVALNTAMLLFSSITFGFAMLRAYKQDQKGAIRWLLVTLFFGLCFLGIELYEFKHMIHAGAGPQRSAFLSAFFALVGTHGLHVTFGSIWLVTLVVQIGKHGLNPANLRRLGCLSLFWHFLDLIWIGVFSIVYLMGMI